VIFILQKNAKEYAVKRRPNGQQVTWKVHSLEALHQTEPENQYKHKHGIVTSDIRLSICRV